jgi:hypothetical protein
MNAARRAAGLSPHQEFSVSFRCGAARVLCSFALFSFGFAGAVFDDRRNKPLLLQACACRGAMSFLLLTLLIWLSAPAL